MTEQHTTQQLPYLDEIYQLILEMRKETAFIKMDIDETTEEKIKATINWCYTNGFLYFCGECLMLGKIYTPWYNNQKHATDILLYTKKESRGKGLASKALSRFIEWAQDNEAHDITLSRSTAINKEEFKMLMTKHGLGKVGEIYSVR